MEVKAPTVNMGSNEISLSTNVYIDGKGNNMGSIADTNVSDF